MPEFYRPQNDDTCALKCLYSMCFDERQEAVEYLFDNLLSFSNAYAARVDNKIVSALYLLPCEVAFNSRNLKAHYLMGASTHPNHRGKGIMGKLIEYALEDAKSYGDKVSVLEPADRSLYGYYSQFGYQEAYGSAVFEYDVIKAAASKQGKTFHLTKSSFDIWTYLRFNICMNIRGSVQWNESHLKACSEISEIYGGGALGFDHGYALYTIDEDGVFVHEFICDNEYVDDFLYSLAKEIGTDKMTVRCPIGIEKKLKSSYVSMGMMMPIDDNINIDFNNAYLGLSLD